MQEKESNPRSLEVNHLRFPSGGAMATKDS